MTVVIIPFFLYLHIVTDDSPDCSVKRSRDRGVCASRGIASLAPDVVCVMFFTANPPCQKGLMIFLVATRVALRAQRPVFLDLDLVD